MRSAPKTPVACCYLLDQADRFGREPRLARTRLRFVLPEPTEELPMPAQKCLRLNEEERLSPGQNHPGQKHQEQPVPLPADGALDLSTQDNQLVT